MDDREFRAGIEFLNWRDERFEAISAQLEGAFPDLLARIDEKIRSAGVLDLARTRVRLKSAVQDLCREWAEEQARKALAETEAAL